MSARTVGAYAFTLVAAVVGCILLAVILALGTHAIANHIDPPAPAHSTPGPEWVHDRGSIYWTCTSDGHALIKDTDTGSTMLARDDRKCDAGG